MQTTAYQDIIVRNRSQRVRDLAFGLLLAAVTTFALTSILAANHSARAATAPAPIHACAVTSVSC